MFKNIGKKIKMLAKIICWFQISLYALAGFILIFVGIIDNTMWYFIPTGIATALLGALFAWIASFFMIGYGELVQSVTNIDKLLSTPRTPVIEEATETPFIIEQD